MARNEQVWRIRVRLYRLDAKGTGELMADTHEGLGDMAPLDERESHRGMAAVLDAVTAMIHGYHDKQPETIEGARSPDLAKRIPTIRVYISNHGGRTVLPVPYTPDGNRAWSAYITIQRDDWAGEVPKPENPSARSAR